MEDSSQLDALDVKGLQALAAACAARMRVVATHFGRRETGAAFVDVLSGLWDALEGGQLDVDRVEERLRSLPEAELDDPCNRGYLAMRALGVLSDAVGAFRFGAPRSQVGAAARAARDGARSLASDVRFQVGDRVEQPISGPDEEAFQLQIYEIVAAAQPDWPVRVRQLCDTSPWPVDVLDELDRIRGWRRRNEG